MKVLLAYRCPDEASDNADVVTLPPGLRWIAASLAAAGHHALVANLSRLGWKDVERYLVGVSPDVVGVSCLTSNRATAARLARLARRTCPSAVIAMGGPHVSAMPDLLLRRVREVDFLVLGEGEISFVEACALLAAGRKDALASVRGVVPRGVAATSSSVEADPERLPRPVVGLDGAGLLPQRDMRHVVASRARGEGSARRSPSSVALEMEELRDEFGVIDVALVGPGLLAGPGWLEQLSTLLLDRQVAANWELSAEISDLVMPGEEVALEEALRRAHHAGCRRLRLLLDGAAAAAELAEPLALASRLLRASGVAAHLTIRHGAPGQGPVELALLRSLVRALQPREGALEALQVLPGTPSWKELSEDEELDDRFWFDESRVFVPAASPRELEVSEGAIEATLREVTRGARPAARDLESLGAKGLLDAWGHLDWGDWRASLADFEEAERRYRLAAEAEPWNPFPWLRLASLFARGRAESGPRPRSGAGRAQADPAREEAALRQALSRVPRHAPSRARLEELQALREARAASGRAPRQRA